MTEDDHAGSNNPEQVEMIGITFQDNFESRDVTLGTLKP